MMIQTGLIRGNLLLLKIKLIELKGKSLAILIEQRAVDQGCNGAGHTSDEYEVQGSLA